MCHTKTYPFAIGSDFVYRQHPDSIKVSATNLGKKSNAIKEFAPGVGRT